MKHNPELLELISRVSQVESTLKLFNEIILKLQDRIEFLECTLRGDDVNTI